uniref:Elongator acetyltransferase complex subunit 4 n=1 Tax=Cercocebus atys TaxID=9531 RepID=A0A2K5LJ78_CERAT
MAAVVTCGSGAGSTGSAVATASKSNVTSFQRRGPRASGTNDSGPRLVSIAGTRPSVRNGQLLVSTGLPALDQLLGSSRFRPYKSFYNCGRQASLEDGGKRL